VSKFTVYQSRFDKNSDDEPHPVGLKKSNPYGLYDIYGNVWEWVQDKYGTLPKGELRDYSGPSSGSARVARGGCWLLDANICRSG